jgi:hypothetical protein
MKSLAVRVSVTSTKFGKSKNLVLRYLTNCSFSEVEFKKLSVSSNEMLFNAGM